MLYVDSICEKRIVGHLSFFLLTLLPSSEIASGKSFLLLLLSIAATTTGAPATAMARTLVPISRTIWLNSKNNSIKQLEQFNQRMAGTIGLHCWVQWSVGCLGGGGDGGTAMTEGGEAEGTEMNVGQKGGAHNDKAHDEDTRKKRDELERLLGHFRR
jgi:hypothetical protein